MRRAGGAGGQGEGVGRGKKERGGAGGGRGGRVPAPGCALHATAQARRPTHSPVRERRAVCAAAAVGRRCGAPAPPPPEPAVAEATGASVSTRFSSSWCSRENPCDGSRPATSIVERCETPTSTRRAQQSGSIVRPATRKRRPVGGTARPRRSGATHPSQKERTVVEPGQYTLRGGLSGSESRTKSSSVSDPPAAEGAAAVDVDGPASPLLPKKGRLAAILAAERPQRGLLEAGSPRWKPMYISFFVLLVCSSA